MQRKLGTLIGIMALAVVLGACSSYHEIPPGHVGKVLTSTGWQEKIWEAGMVDLGQVGQGGNQNILVLLEADSITVKEQFLTADAMPDKQDHRVLTKKTPLTVDVRIRALVPPEPQVRNNIFVQVTPWYDKNDPRRRWISVQKVYEQFATMDVRNRIRLIFSQYDDYKEVMLKYTEVNTKVTQAIIEAFEKNKVPLKLQGVGISNVKPDPQVWEAENTKASAAAKVSAIDDIGEALRKNPMYVHFQQWETAEKVAAIGAQKGNNTVVIVGNNGAFNAETAAVAAEMAKRK